MKTINLVLSIGFICCNILLFADVINVPTDQPTIQAGIDVSIISDTVLVQPGTYVENINFNGKLITVGSLFLTTQDPTYISSTTIDGDNSGSVVSFESGEELTSVLCGFTLTNGLAGVSPYDNGGGIICFESSPSLQNLIISGNAASADGGGIYVWEGNPNVEYVTISGNTASGNGGGIYFYESTSSVHKVTITGNNAVDGGGIYCNSGSPSFEKITVTGNTASNHGGGVYSYQISTPNFVNSIFWNDSPEEIYVWYSSITVTYSDIQGGFTGAGNIDADPLFVNPGSENYHMLPGSPCIDAGDPASPLDPDGTISDMGVFYFDQHFGSVWHVSTSGSDIAGSGSEQNPFATIQYGINISSDTDTVIVQPGTYYENINFNGKLIALGSLFLTTQDTNYINSTAIDGFYNGSVVTFNNGEDSTAVLSGFILVHGDAIDGGGIYCESSSPSIENLKLYLNNAYDGGGITCYDHANPGLRNLVIMHNDADNGAGGILINNYSNPTLENITIANNTADWGGGIYVNYYSSPSLSNVVVSDNVSKQGGGIFCNSSNPSLVNVSILDNIATEHSGGIFCYIYSDPSLKDVIITGNTADTLGGGFFCAYASDPILQNVTISDNSANWRGGGVCIIGSDPIFEDVIITENSADRGGGCYIEVSSPSFENVFITDNAATGPNGYGGGVYCYDYSNPILHNVLIAGNNALYGGGVFCYDADPTLDKVTITGNTASIEGGGIFNGVGSNPVLINSILWDDLPEEIVGGVGVAATYSDIEGGFTGTGNINTDPLFVNPAGNDYHLQVISPCIDAGDPDPQYFDTDGTVADMGAYFVNQYGGPIWYVSETGSDETGSGWEQYPFLTIQHGINMASDADTVIVKQGTYEENINFNGKLITVGSLFLTTQDTAYISSTVIDGNSSGSVVKFYNNEDTTSVLTGFTITNGSGDYGGGIDLDNSSPRLNNLIITNNSVNLYGGGIVCYLSNTILQNITISDNSAEYGGGIMFWSCDDPSLENVIISGNTASIVGGGLHCYNNSNPNLTNVSITENTAYEDGGGIYCYVDCNPSIENVTISNNTAYINGGGICLNNSNSNLINSILWNDSPDEIYIYSGSVTASYSDIQGGIVGAGNIDSDPLFVDPLTGDYSLQLASPCVDAGDPTFPLDPDSSIIEMGAYYHPQFIDAEFVADLTNGVFPSTVSFTDLSLPGTGDIDEWHWDFGDGKNSSLQHPTNEYFSIGYYSVSLRVTNDLDSTNTETKVDYITVTPPAYDGNVWHISVTGSDPPFGNGSSQYPFATIQHGIDVAANTDTVLVQPGVYIENINYNGKLLTLGSLFLTTQDTSYISQTIIDGDSIANVVSFVNGEDSTAVLCGFTITNGSTPLYYSGGGIVCYSSSPSLHDLTIKGNNTSSNGGGIYLSGSSSNLQNVTIAGNNAVSGGGVYLNGSSPDILNVTISGNTASSFGGGGGGVYCVDSHPNLVNVNITGNSAVGYGGGIHLDYSSIPILKNVSIVNNSAEGGGGIYCYYYCLPSLLNVTISKNTAASHGGGISSQYGSNVSLSNSILWNNSPEEIYNIGTGLTTATYSDIQGGYAGTGNINSDPLFANPGNGNYRLLSTSPCIDAGDPASPLDLDGTIVDMGAFYNDQHFGAVWHVSTSGSDITGSGSEQNPFATIQHGIDISSNTDTVLVHPGTYLENINFNGKLIILGSLYLTTQDTGYISSTIIDGNSSGSVVTFENSENESAILKGFTITNGNAYSGGGIRCLNATNPGLENLIISGNYANIGGGIYCYINAFPSLQNVTIIGNIAYYNGGGLNIDNNCFPVLINVTISDNFAQTGGGIFCLNSNPILINSILWSNQPQSIYIAYGDPVVATYSNIQGGWPGAGNISSDPLFADPGNGDYHLQYNSPCIDVGDPVSPLDPDGTIADMGAYYFHKYSGPVWHISTSGSDITGNGSEQYPFATIQHGIDNSADTDTVLVQPGTYVENIDYNGKLIMVGSLFLTTTYTSYISTTIIDGNSSGRVVSFSNGEDTTAVLTGFTIMNGYASGSFPDNGGGGIFCGSSSPSLQHLVIMDNSANSGGGILLRGSNSKLKNITLSNNSVSHHGGGLYCYDSSNPLLQNVIITGNSSGYYGGGIMCYLNSSPGITNVTISNNSSSDGGGIYCGADSYPDFKNAILWNDSPQEIYVASGAVTATYSDIEGSWTGTGNIDSNPLFWNPSNGDYHLQSGSPCINAGDPLSPIDPDGSIVDIGAYYFISSEINLKVFLQGPFNTSNMNIDLNSFGLIPTNQPYDISPWNYSGTESVSSIPASVVDWVLVELRDAQDINSATPATIIDQRAVFLRNDGKLVDLDGVANLRMNNPINQRLFVVIRQRNHIDVMSAYPLTETAGVYSYDFRTIDQAIGVDATIPLGAGAYGMYSGDANADGLIDEFDKSGVWILEAGKFDYLRSDLNLDSQSNNIDKNDFWFMNRGNGCQVPE